jgi:hypothetical protein
MLAKTKRFAVDSIVTQVGTSVLQEGVRFLYQQAAEILASWRARRRDPDAPSARLLPSPEGVMVGAARPADVPSQLAIDALQEVKDLVEPLTGADAPLGDAAARQAIAALRELVEAALGTSITFAGEEPRPLSVSGVGVAAARIEGRVTGLRANLAKLQGAEISDVRVDAGDVASGGEVTGVDLT